jgi:Cdc6-like AAA superfamily ATPase
MKTSFPLNPQYLTHTSKQSTRFMSINHQKPKTTDQITFQHQPPVHFGTQQSKAPIYTIAKLEDDSKKLDEQIQHTKKRLASTLKGKSDAANEGAVNGLMLGTIGGLLAEVIVHTATGGISLLFVGSIAGSCAVAGATLEEYLSGTDNPTELRAGIQQLEILKQKNDQLVKEYQMDLTQLRELLPYAKKAKEESQITDKQLSLVSKTLKSGCMDLQEAAQPVFSELKKIPGVGKKLDDTIIHVDSIKTLQEESLSRSPEERHLAIYKLLKLEMEANAKKWDPNYEYSIEAYNRLVFDPDATVKAEALRGLVSQRKIRLENYPKLLELNLRDSSEEVKSVAMDGIQKDPFSSDSIDIELERIKNINNGYPETLRLKAEKLLFERQKSGISKLINPDQVANTIMDGFVGTDELKKDLSELVSGFKYRTSLASHVGPNIKLYLPGEPGIGKTLLMSRLSNALFSAPDSFVRINMESVKSLYDITKTLKQAEPLAGKMIFLDEFQGLDAVPSPLDHAQVVGFIKALIDNDKSGLDGFDFKNTVLAIATNVPVEKMDSLKSAKGKPIASRILSKTKEINLQGDLKHKMKELVDGFDTHQYYIKETPHLEGIRLDDSAKAHFLKKFNQKFPSTSTEIVSGRYIIGQMTTDIELLIAAYCNKLGSDIERLSDGSGRSKYPILVTTEPGTGNPTIKILKPEAPKAETK